MNRRFFIGISTVIFNFFRDSIPKKVLLVNYFDKNQNGKVFDLIGEIPNPPVINEHYFPLEKLWAIKSNGIILHVYEKEFVLI